MSRSSRCIPALDQIIGELVKKSDRGLSAPVPTVVRMSSPVLNNIELPATDMAATKAFYTEVFGWNWTEYGPTYSAADANGVEVGLSTDASPAALPPTDDESSIGPLVLLQTDDLKAAVTAVTTHGGEIVTRPFDFPGGRRFHFRDPSGNVLGIYRITTA